MNKTALFEQIKKKRSFLCVGLDTDLNKIPAHLLAFEDPIFEFNKQIIEATKDYAVAYKPNLAFYEMLGSKGWESLQKTLDYIPNEIFTIADAKRGDIGNTSSYYAKTFYDTYNFDSITIAPYMGSDSVSPFIREGKWAIVLGLTSNPGGLDFQNQVLGNGLKVYEHVISESSKWGSDQNMMYVVGATRSEFIADLRKIVPDHFFLVPGVGAQGGSLIDVAKAGLTKECGLLVNSSRAIIYAGSGKDFADESEKAAKKVQLEMEEILSNASLL